MNAIMFVILFNVKKVRIQFPVLLGLTFFFRRKKKTPSRVPLGLCHSNPGDPLPHNFPGLGLTLIKVDFSFFLFSFFLNPIL